jgi:hypothetical protein
VERGYRFQNKCRTREYFESGESEVYPFKKITYRESEQHQQQEQQLETDLSSSSAESFIPFSESFRISIWEVK